MEKVSNWLSDGIKGKFFDLFYCLLWFAVAHLWSNPSKTLTKILIIIIGVLSLFLIHYIVKNNKLAHILKEYEESPIIKKREELIELLSVYLEDPNKFDEDVHNMSDVKFNKLQNVLDEFVVDVSTCAGNAIAFNSDNRTQMVKDIIQEVKNGKLDLELESYW